MPISVAYHICLFVGHRLCHYRNYVLYENEVQLISEVVTLYYARIWKIMKWIQFERHKENNYWWNVLYITCLLHVKTSKSNLCNHYNCSFGNAIKMDSFTNVILYGVFHHNLEVHITKLIASVISPQRSFVNRSNNFKPQNAETRKF